MRAQSSSSGAGQSGDPEARSAGAHLLLGAAFVVLCWRYRVYFTDLPLPSVDLEGHIALVARLLEQLRGGSLFFYDVGWFTGWPAFHFYGFLPHLIAALLAGCLRPFAVEPARLAVHLLLVLGCALLPATMYWAARGLAPGPGDAGGRRAEDPLLAALVPAALAIWFLNLGGLEGYGVGAAAVMHLGLYSQLFAWHLVLFYTGTLFRILRRGERHHEVLLCLALFALVLSHPLSVPYAAFLGSLSWLGFRRCRAPLAAAHGIGLALAAFWLLPLLALVRDYTLLDIEGARTASLLLFLVEMATSLRTALQQWWSGHMAWPDPIVPFLALLLAGLTVHLYGRRRTLLGPAAAWVVAAALFFSWSWLPEHVPVGVHYYRLATYTVLSALVLLSSVPAHLLAAARSGRDAAALRAISYFACLGGIAFAMTHPHPAVRLLAENDSQELLADANAVLRRLGAEPGGGRVLFESLNDQRTFRTPVPHYLSSRLHAATGRESVNGLFIQSSFAYTFPRLSADALGAHLYATAFLTFPSFELPDAVAVEQLRSLGVTHVVLARPAFSERLRPFALSPEISIGPYRIVEIGTPRAPAGYLNRPAVGYLDLLGTLPFKYVEIYFASRQRLGTRFEPLELGRDRPIPPEVGVVVVNGGEAAAAAALAEMSERGRAGGFGEVRPKVVRLEYRGARPSAPAPEERAFVGDFEVRWYRRAAHYLNAALPPEALGGDLAVAPPHPGGEPRLIWSALRQSFTLDGVAPGRLVRVNYSYFPYWRAAGGHIYRGAAERIFALAPSSSLRAFYSRRGTAVVLGDLLTLAALVVFAIRHARHLAGRSTS